MGVESTVIVCGLSDSTPGNRGKVRVLLEPERFATQHKGLKEPLVYDHQAPALLIVQLPCGAGLAGTKKGTKSVSPSSCLALGVKDP